MKKKRLLVPAASFRVGPHVLGFGQRAFVIAEAGVNHNGDPELAHRLVDVAADAGADAVKFQTFDPSQLVSPTAPKAPYQERADGQTQSEMLESLALSHDAHVSLVAHAARRGILFLSTPFDEASADFLDSLGVAAFKIGSGDLTHHPLLAHVARLRRPMLLSTGMSTLSEVQAAFDVVRGAGLAEIALLHCVSSYPAPAEAVNLRCIPNLQKRFGVPVGYSDHTESTDIAMAAVTMGAEIVEKHVTLDKHLPGPDHAASLEPNELAAMIRGIRRVESALGDGDKRPMSCEAPIAAVARRSLHVARDVEAGAIITPDDLVVLRPGHGIAPSRFASVVGRVARRHLSAGTLLREIDLSRPRGKASWVLAESQVA